MLHDVELWLVSQGYAVKCAVKGFEVSKGETL